MNSVSEDIEVLRGVLESIPRVAVAVSGGVDSLTLATFTHRHTATRVEMFHAVSPAVPAEATERVQTLARRDGWALTLVDAGEFRDPLYRSNPVNRCFHCKSHLYGAIAEKTDSQIVSGTNLDDLGEYRPGLEAASESAVRHPWVEAGIGKQALRGVAQWLGLGKVAELPASPCLSSRIETGIVIEPDMLDLVHRVENMVRESVGASTVRCRVRARGMVIELDEHSLKGLSDARVAQLRTRAMAFMSDSGRCDELSFEPYRNGSAFLLPSQIAGD